MRTQGHSNSWASICMENNLILKIRWKNPLVGKLFQLYGDFLPQVYWKVGCEMYIEKVADGVLVFYKSMTDFVKFHQVAGLVNLPEPPRNHSPNKKNGLVEFYVETVKLPPNITVDDLLPGVARCYQMISKNIEVEKTSESSGVIRYKDAYTFEALIEFLMDFWDKNKDARLDIPKNEEVTGVFENLTL